MAIRAVAVIGAGAMGPDIWLSAALSGFPARLWARNPESLQAAVGRARRNLDRLVIAEMIDRDESAACLDRLGIARDLTSACAGADLVIEAIAEDLAIKRAVLAQAERAVAPDAILSSTTSSLSATMLAEPLARPHRYINIHYAQPAHLMPLVEVVPGAQTSSDVTARVCEWLWASSRVPVVVKDVPGFAWTRLQMAILRECLALVRDAVATPAELDLILKYGYAVRLPVMGAFEHADLGGLDLIEAICRNVWPALDDTLDPKQGPLGDMLAQGYLGMKTGRGFYDWTTRDPQVLRDARDDEIMRRLRTLAWHPRGWRLEPMGRRADNVSSR